MTAPLHRLVEAARRVVDTWRNASEFKQHEDASNELAAALAEYEAGAAAPTPTAPPAEEPTNEELATVAREAADAYASKSAWPVADVYDSVGRRALYNRGLADMRGRCVALLGEAAAKLRAEQPELMHWEARALELEDAAAAVEALGAEERTR